MVRSKEVIIFITDKNINYYKNKYQIVDNKITIPIEDLTMGSKQEIVVKCD